MPLQSADSRLESPRSSIDRGVVIVGNDGGTNVGSSFREAAGRSHQCVQFCDARTASAGPRVFRAMAWRLGGHRPPRLANFSAEVARVCRAYRPNVLLATGIAPVTAHALAEIGAMGIRRINYLTDDPWNPAFSSKWFFQALPNYDQVFTVRRANLEDLRRLGCPTVDYLPFAHDAQLFGCGAPGRRWPNGIRRCFRRRRRSDRVPFIKALLETGLRVALGAITGIATRKRVAAVSDTWDPANCWR